MTNFTTTRNNGTQQAHQPAAQPFANIAGTPGTRGGGF